MSYRTQGEFPSVRGGQGLSKGRQSIEGVAGGLEQGGWGLGWVSKGLGAGAWRGPRSWGEWGGAGPSGDGTDVRSFARSFARSPCSIGHRPLRVRCPKRGLGNRRICAICNDVFIALKACMWRSLFSSKILSETQ